MAGCRLYLLYGKLCDLYWSLWGYFKVHINIILALL